jgi:hypothetical protein
MCGAKKHNIEILKLYRASVLCDAGFLREKANYRRVPEGVVRAGYGMDQRIWDKIEKQVDIRFYWCYTILRRISTHQTRVLTTSKEIQEKIDFCFFLFDSFS